MYAEYRYVRADATFKNALLIAGTLAAPLLLLTLPDGQHVDGGTLVGFIIILALLGALAGTVIGYGIDQAIGMLRSRSEEREAVARP